jgi:putative phosphoribosyl transferase
MIFRNRKESCEKWLSRIEHYKNSKPLILAVPKGGIEIAFYIAGQLQAEISVIISKKLSYPGHEEYAFGAICENDNLHLIGQKHCVTDALLQKIIEHEKKEIKQKVNNYRGGKPLPNLNGRTVILTDDGLSSGITLIPAIHLCRQLNAAKVVVAIPLTGRVLDPQLNEADDIILIQQPELFCNLKEARKAFKTLSDSEIFSFISKQPVFFS